MTCKPLISKVWPRALLAMPQTATGPARTRDQVQQVAALALFVASWSNKARKAHAAHYPEDDFEKMMVIGCQPMTTAQRIAKYSAPTVQG
jgi:hypothetical protein